MSYANQDFRDLTRNWEEFERDRLAEKRASFCEFDFLVSLFVGLVIGAMVAVGVLL